MKSRLLALVALCALSLYGMHRTGINPDSIGAGVIGDQRDPLHIMTLIGWTFRALSDSQLQYWDPPYFFPLHNTLSYSETFLLPSLILMPLVAFTQGVTVPYNVIFLANYVLSAFAAYLLVFFLTRSWWASLFAGVQFGFSTFMISHYAQIPYTFAVFIPLALLFLLRFARTSRLQDCIFFALSILAQILSCLTYGIFLATAVGIALVLIAFLNREARSARNIISLGIAGVLIVSVTLLYAQPYLERAGQQGGKSSPLEASYFSACLRDYALGIQGNPIYGESLQPKNPSKTAGAWLFPGVVTLMFAMLGVRARPRDTHLSNATFAALVILSLSFAIGFIRLCLGHAEGGLVAVVSVAALSAFALKQKTSTARGAGGFGYEVRLFSIFTLIFFVLTFGPIVHLHTTTIQWSPYQLLYEYFPGFSGVRNASRIYIIFSLGLTTLAGFGVSALLQRFRSHFVKLALGVVIVSFGALEHYSPPFSVARLRILDEHQELDAWLRQTPSPSPLLELPRETVDIDTMYRALWRHAQPTVGGYSSYLPQFTGWFMEKMREFPSDDALRLIRQLGIRYLVLHPYRWSDKLADPTFWRENGALKAHDFVFVREFEGPQTLVFQVAEPLEIPRLKLSDYAQKIQLIFPRSVRANSTVHAALQIPILEPEGRLSLYPTENSSIVARWRSRARQQIELESDVRLEGKFLFTPADSQVQLFIPTPPKSDAYTLEVWDGQGTTMLLSSEVSVDPA